MRFYLDKASRLRECRLRIQYLDEQMTRTYNFILDLDNTIKEIERLIEDHPEKQEIYLSNTDIIRRSRGEHMTLHRKIAFELDIAFGRSLEITDEKQLSKEEINDMLDARSRRKSNKPNEVKRLNGKNINTFLKAEGYSFSV